MPFEYERDDANHRVAVRFRGVFSLEEGLDVIGRHRDIKSYGVLYDLCGLTGGPTVADLRSLMAEEASGSPGLRGPIALVAKDPLMYQTACTYALLGRSELLMAVFRDSHDADAWLCSNL